MCGLRAGAEILSTCFKCFRRDLFSTPSYLPELFNGDPISTACFLSFPIRTRKRSKRPKTNILTLAETKFHTVNDLLWFSKKQAVSAWGRRGWNCRSKGSWGLSQKAQTKLAQSNETFEISPFKLGLSQVIQLQASGCSDQNPGAILEICLSSHAHVQAALKSVDSIV